VSAFKREYERIGAAITTVGECFGGDKNSCMLLIILMRPFKAVCLFADALGLTQAVKYTGDTYEKIGQLYEDQVDSEIAMYWTQLCS
jgi:hypothetical protein